MPFELRTPVLMTGAILQLICPPEVFEVGSLEFLQCLLERDASRLFEKSLNSAPSTSFSECETCELLFVYTVHLRAQSAVTLTSPTSYNLTTLSPRTRVRITGASTLSLSAGAAA